ncbi:AMP-binding protein [Clostridium ganghwense]|uniref:AMP-binding protein n=1 Tax=Clostridium ganghwense TaxID=312089 RepID=A0ABT4CVE5_9CLOT|nr:AMP-binding protein [Clostridium ganghwense]MCY6371924.1 AMP-binding protein [Clostridium ganghwense]
MIFTDYVFEFSSKLEKTAVIDKREISYKEVYNDIKNIASILKYKKFSKKDSVLLVSENSCFSIQCYFGIMKNGSVCIPVNPSVSSEEIKYIADILNIKLVFAQKKYKKKIEEVLSKEVEIYTENEVYDFISSCDNNCYDNEVKAESISGNDTAVMIFTSGSTSKPKGVMLTHNNLIHNTDSIIKYLSLTEEDRVEVVLPFYYCYGTSLLHTHFRVGGSLVLNNRFMFPQTVIEDINKYKCTSFAGVPSTYQILLRMTNMKDTKFPSLRYITQAGGKLANTFIKDLKGILKSTDIYIMYGQTEATARLSYLPPHLIEEKIGSIGKGIPGTELKVLNKEGLPVKTGEIGEVVAKGKNIMKGYFNSKEETDAVLKNGYLYTGDLATVDKDEYIYIVSREKNIIKSGGNRTSPKEIEDVIVQIPQVVECAVIGVYDDILGEAVKAFVVLKDNNTNIDAKFIKSFCKERLASYKVPQHIEFLKGLPKNSSGKVLIQKLKEMEKNKSGK